MLENSPQNVKLTFDQLQQIDVAEKRLAHLQIEVSLATKLLTETRLDCEKVTKEKIYQEGLLADINSQLSSATLKHDKLLEDIKASEGILNSNTEKSVTIGLANEKKEKDLNERESKIIEREIEHSKKEKDFITNSNNLSKEKSLVENAKGAFLKATESITWK